MPASTEPGATPVPMNSLETTVSGRRIKPAAAKNQSEEPATCPHGGRVYDTVGQDFTRLDRLGDVLAADVLDAWYPPAPSVLEALSANLPWCVRTSPPLHAGGLRETIAASRGINSDQIVLGCGSSDLIFRVVPRFLSGEGPIVIPQPSYAEYRHVLTQLHGREVIPFYTDQEDFMLNVDKLVSFIHSVGATGVCLVNPCNPTGFALPKKDMLALLDGIAGTPIVVDETYIDYIGKEESLESSVEDYPNLMTLKSVSKFYALSGMRVGYAVAASRIGKQFQLETPPYIVSTPGQMAAIAAFEAEDYYLGRVAETHRLREEFASALRTLPGLRVMPSNINCMLLDLKNTGWRAPDFWQALLDRNLLSRDIGHQGLTESDRYVRVAVLCAEDNQRMVEIISEVVQSRSPGEDGTWTPHSLCA